MPTHCLINSNLIRPLTGSSLDLDSREGGGTWQKYRRKTQPVSVSHKGKLQVAPKSLTSTVQKGRGYLWPSVGNTEEAKEKCERVERAGMNRPKPS